MTPLPPGEVEGRAGRVPGLAWERGVGAVVAELLANLLSSSTPLTLSAWAAR
ncbi:MAG: hypothetical protein IPI43_11365 [Sandaracinaceae bacterium]|nr:hypothetical protein [Sandaracinaceae bacterium]